MGRNASAEQSRLQKSRIHGREVKAGINRGPAIFSFVLLRRGVELPGHARRPSRRSWTESDKDDLLKALGDCRAACIRARGISLLSKKDVYNGRDGEH